MRGLKPPLPSKSSFSASCSVRYEPCRQRRGRALVRLRAKNLAPKTERKLVPEFAAQSLLRTPTVTIRDVYCQGRCRHQGEEECAAATALVLPYRGVYVHH